MDTSDAQAADPPAVVRPSWFVAVIMGPPVKALNPVILKLAGRRHVRMAAQIRHVGRRSGRPYITPARARVSWRAAASTLWTVNPIVQNTPPLTVRPPALSAIPAGLCSRAPASPTRVTPVSWSTSPARLGWIGLACQQSQAIRSRNVAPIGPGLAVPGRALT
jgi:hypothetical protein